MSDPEGCGCGEGREGLYDLMGHDERGHRLANVLARNKLYTVEQVRGRTDSQLLGLRGMGRMAFERLHERIPDHCADDMCRACRGESEIERLMGHDEVGHRLAAALAKVRPEPVTTLAALMELTDEELADQRNIGPLSMVRLHERVPKHCEREEG